MKYDHIGKSIDVKKLAISNYDRLVNELKTSANNSILTIFSGIPSRYINSELDFSVVKDVLTYHINAVLDDMINDNDFLSNYGLELISKQVEVTPVTEDSFYIGKTKFNYIG